MKIIPRLFLLIFLFGADSIITYSQWVETKGPMGCHISNFYISGNKVFALTYDSIYVSTTNGKSWMGINNGLSDDNYGFRSFAVIDSNLFVNTYGGAFFHSSNTGASWSQYNTTIPTASIWDFAVCDTNLFAGTYGTGVFKSTDDGISWNPVNNGLKDLHIQLLKAKGRGLVAWNNDGIFLTSDYGSSWNLIASSSMGFSDIAVEDSTLYAYLMAGASAGIYYSTDMGKNWNHLSSDPPNLHVTVLMPNGKDLFVGAYDGIDGGVFVTSNFGNNWKSLNNGLTNHYISSIAILDSLLFAGTGTGGAYISTNYGDSWTETGNGIKDSIGLIITSLAINQGDLIAGTWGGGIFLSSNSARSWKPINNGLKIKNIVSLVAQDTKLFAGTTVSGVFVSENNGESWTAVNDGLPYYGKEYQTLPIAVSGSNVYAGFWNDTAGVYKTTNSGTTWISVKTNLPFQAINGISCFVTTDTSVYLGGLYGVFYSTNGGVSWNADTTGLPSNGLVSSLTILDTNIFAGTMGHGVYCSSINGISWKQVSNGLPTMGTEVNCITVDGQNLFAGIPDEGVYLSTNLGESWINVTKGLTNLRIFALISDGTNVFIGTGGNIGQGIWTRPLAEMITSVKDNATIGPTHFSLSQNYPNPFNPTTTISFSIDKRSLVTLKVYNALGREIETLVNREEMPGSYVVRFNGVGLASGVYFYQLKAGDNVSAKKMILLK